MAGKPFNIDEFMVENRESILEGSRIVAADRARRIVQRILEQLNLQIKGTENPVDDSSPRKLAGDL